MHPTNNNLAADHITEIWDKEVPLKVSLFAWCLLRNRLPTIDNLVKRQFYNQMLSFVWADVACWKTHST